MNYIRTLYGILSLMLLSSAYGAIDIKTNPPEILAAVDGTTVTLEVKAESTTPGTALIYQWYKGNDATDKTGNKTNKLVLSAIKPADNGKYVLKIIESTAPGVDFFTDGTMITVNTRPKIKTQPVGLTVTQGATAAFDVEIDPTGTAPFTYTWQKKVGKIWETVGGGVGVSDFEIPNAQLVDNGGSYRVQVTNVTGVVVTSKEAVLKVNSRPVITTQPVSTLNIASKASATLKVVVVGNTPLTYKWFKGDPDGEHAQILTAKAATLTLKGEETSTATAGAGTYYVEVTNNLSPDEAPTRSTLTTVAVFRKPTIVTPPSKAPATAGAAHSLTVVPSLEKTGTLTYRWLKDGVVVANQTIEAPAVNPRIISGATTASLSFTPISWLDRGSYKVIISNEVGSITSAAVALNVSAVPVILTQPVNTVGPTKGSRVFTVVAGGTAPLKYQWHFKPIDGSFAPILKGGTAAKLTVSKLSAESQGDYKVVVSNTISGTTTDVTSDSASLVVEDAPVIKTQPVGSAIRSGNPLTLTVELASGTGPLTYVWTKNKVVVGPNAATLTVADAAAVDSGSYQVTITNRVGVAVSKAVKVDVQQPPVITVQPEDDTGIQTEFVGTSVAATGTASLKYQWFKKVSGPGGSTFEKVSGKTSAVLAFQLAKVADAGVYHCVVTNAVGTATSAEVTLNVNPIPAATITGFNPSIARVGDKMRLFGSNLRFVEIVSIGGREAGVVKESDTSLLLTVPPGDAVDTPVDIKVKNKTVVVPTVIGGFTRSSRYANNSSNKTLLFGTSNAFYGSTIDIETVHGGAQNTWLAYYRWRVPVPSTVTVIAMGQNNFDLDLSLQLCDINNNPTGSGIYQDIIDQSTETASISTTFPNQEIEIIISGVRGANVSNPRGIFTFQGAATPKGATVTSKGAAGASEGVAADAWLSSSGDSSSVMSASEEKGTTTVTFGGDAAATEPVFLWTNEGADGSAGNFTTTSFNMSLESVEAGGDDTFSWQVEDPSGESLIALWFDTKTGEISVVEPSGARHATGQRMVAGANHKFEISVDNVAGTWSATMDGVSLTPPVSLSGEAAFGNVSAVWGLGEDGVPSGAVMKFDHFKVTSFQ